MSEESKLAEKLAEKEQAVKFTEEEIGKLNGIRDTYLDIQHQFGQTAIMKLRLEEQHNSLGAREDSLREAYSKNQNTEREFLKEINNKYGDGELNPETGEFIPNKS
tara:strand:+ start:288 stop:605 length:318 start_codon:yes stop_codon:yes gene_type:complete